MWLCVITINIGGDIKQSPTLPPDDVNVAEASKGNVIIVSAHKALPLYFQKPQPVTWSQCQYVQEKDGAGIPLQAKGQGTKMFGIVS